MTLGFDEFEALRLTDFLGYSQKEAAESMGISQQTLSRILRSARRTLSEGVVLGLLINIKPSKQEGRNKAQKVVKSPPR